MEVILTHEHADFDAIASMVGLSRLVPGAVPVLPQTVNANVAEFLTLYGGGLGLVARGDLRRRRLSRVWVVDTRRPASVRGMAPDTPRSVIDHHSESGEGGHEDGADIDLDIQPVGATATLIAERMIQAAVAPTAMEATLLLLGIHEDTGSLTYAGTTPRDVRAAAWLLEQGADLDVLARFLRHSLSDTGRGLYLALAEAAETMDVAGHHIVISAVEAHGYTEEVSTLATKLFELLEPDALFILVALGETIQLVARSAHDDVDAGTVAEAFGGGGHAHAAAATIRGGVLPTARAKLITLLPAAVRAGLRVADLMSRGQVRALDVGTTVEEALAYARRYGHEGYPVLDGAAVAGVLTRRDLDRAAHHNLGREPIRRLVTAGAVTARPEDGIDTLQHRMIAHNLGQVPVVDDEGRLIGIVTRTDLLQLWAARARPGRQAPTTVDVAAAIPPADLEAVRQLAALARERGERAFLVGGLPRDLLLGRRPGPDIDLVIEGDAVALARAVADRHGGAVRAHPRFGTAKWLRGEVDIDLASTRAEYYTAPSELPVVERGSLRTDLQRRDFTINALAIDVDAARFGQVRDAFDGLADLREGRIRALHPLSFVEDPTRILRAVRLENRLGFNMDPGTLALVPGAVGLLERTSGARIRAELRQLFAEPDPAAALARLEDLGALAAILPGLTAGWRVAPLLDVLVPAWAWFQDHAPCLGLDDPPLPALRLALWLAENGPLGLRAAGRLRLTSAEGRVIEVVLALWAAGGPLADAASRPSAAFHAIERLARHVPQAIPLAWAGAIDPALRGHLRRYAGEQLPVRIALTSADLAALGVQPGPRYGQVLRAVLDARLDGHVGSREEELALASQIATGEQA